MNGPSSESTGQLFIIWAVSAGYFDIENLKEYHDMDDLGIPYHDILDIL